MTIDDMISLYLEGEHDSIVTIANTCLDIEDLAEEILTYMLDEAKDNISHPLFYDIIERWLIDSVVWGKILKKYEQYLMEEQ